MQESEERKKKSAIPNLKHQNGNISFPYAHFTELTKSAPMTIFVEREGEGEWEEDKNKWTGMGLKKERGGMS